MELNLADLLECVADTVPDREALVCGQHRLTYRDLDLRATRLAHGLAGAGVGAGDHVGLYLYNCVEFLETMLAAFKLRAVPVNVNHRYVGEELAQLVRSADLIALVHHLDLRPHVSAVRSRLRTVVEVDAGGGDGDRPDGAFDYDELVRSGSYDRDFDPRSGDDSYILCTGGTTGLPKAVVWRQEDIFYAILGGGNPGGEPIRRAEEIGRTVLENRAQRARPYLSPGDRGPDQFVVLPLGPLVHAGGQWLALGTLLGGGKVVLYPHRHMDMRRVLDLVDRERVTMLSLVGDASARPMLELLESPGARYETSSVLLLGSGGAMLSGDVKDRLMAALPSVLALVDGMGSSESPSQAVAVMRRGQAPVPSLRFAAKDTTMVLDDDLRPVPPGSGLVGRLATRGRLPLGYYKDSAATARTFVEIGGRRWALPGDMATVDADGTVRLLGRGAMCINTGGEKVYPEEVEAVLKSHPLVADALAVGRPDARMGQRVVAVVEPEPGGDPPTLESLQHHCRSRLAGYKVPRALVIVEQVLRSSAGKADHRWAAGVVAAQEADPRRSDRRPTPR